MSRRLSADVTRELARSLIDRRDTALRGVAEARAAQARNGWPYNLAADRLEGSAAAYAIACTLVTNYAGEPDVHRLADVEPIEQCAALIDGLGDRCPWPVDRPSFAFTAGGAMDNEPTECAYHRALRERV